MSVLLPFLALDQTCEHVKALANEKLTRLGLRVVQTFDLRVARVAHPECPCPHHGTDECNCQMIVLLVYEGQSDPVTLIIHGQDGTTWLSLASPVAGRHSNQHLEAAIRRALMPRQANLPSATETKYEIQSTV